MTCMKQYEHHDPEWCPGCGNFDILECLKQALCDLDIPPREIILATGIGQAGKMGFSVKCNMFNGLHGRALPIAVGIKMANPEAKVVAVSGDGCMYAEGGNHLIHTLRRNLDITILVGDNRVYGLTKGQASPTSAYDFKSKVHVQGVGSEALNPIALSLAAGATFVATGFSGDKEQLTGLIKEGIAHRGAALIDILSPCVSFNKVNTFAWFKQRVRPVGPEHDPADFEAAVKLAASREEQIPTGIVYRVQRPAFGDHLTAMKGESIARRTQKHTPERVRPVFEKFR